MSKTQLVLLVAIPVLLINTGCQQFSKPVPKSFTSSNFEPAKYSKLVVVVQDVTGNFRGHPAVIQQVETAAINELGMKGYQIVSRDTGVVDREVTRQHSDMADSDAAQVGK